MTRSGSRALAWGLCALTIAVAIAFVVIAIIDPNAGGPKHVGAAGPSPHDEPSPGFFPYALLSAIVFSSFALVGCIVASRRPRNPVGWFLGAGALLWSLGVLSSALYWHIAFGQSDRPLASVWLAWLGSWVFLPAFTLLLSLTPLLFPTGAPPGPRWRVVGWTAAVAGAIATLSNAFVPGALSMADFAWVDNPVGVKGLGLRVVAGASFVLVGASAIAGVVSLVVRYRRAHGIERLQVKWVAAAGCLLLVGGLGGSFLSGWLGQGAGWIGILAGLLAVAGAIGIALLRYRLYDLDVVVNRTLVYATLTAILAAVYVGSVLLLQLALSGITGGSGLAVASSTLAAAALFRPLRRRVQNLVDQRFYRRRYDARLTLQSFGAQLRNEVDLDALGGALQRVIAETMQPAHVSLWLRTPGERM